MKQTLSGGRGWKWVEEEIGSPQGAPAWRQGWVFALHLKLSEVSMGEERGKDIAGEPSAPGREMRIPKAKSVHQLFFFFFLPVSFPLGKKPQGLSGSLM